MEQFKEFILRYRGAIIGGAIAIVALILNIHKFLVGCLIIAAGVFAGNYVQQNKEFVKDFIRRLVDRW